MGKGIMSLLGMEEFAEDFVVNRTTEDTSPQMRKTKYYISGKMSGLPDHGFPAFNKAAKKLVEMGYDVVNPAEHPEQTSWEEYMRHDIRALMDCDGVVVLDNWKDSKGAKIEVNIAHTLKMPVFDLDFNEIKPEDERNPAEVATDLVYGDRCASYGHPREDFERTARMWSGLFKDKLKEDFQAKDVALAMTCVKMSREMNRPKQDNIIDGIGYFICYDRIVNNR
jgi:hypothetical protein